MTVKPFCAVAAREVRNRDAAIAARHRKIMRTMLTYYNDNDLGCVVWMQDLMKAGLIPEGFVDDRSITEVEAEEVIGFNQCHFFAGIGGWSRALQLAGWGDRPVWTASLPCQPFSVAGKGLAKRDSRHLWPTFRELVAQCRPTTLFGEQVASKDGRAWLFGVRADLEALGYEVGSADLCAASVGSPHKRQRLYWVAHTESARLQRFPGYANNLDKPGRLNENATGPIAESGSDKRMANFDGGNTGMRRLQCGGEQRQLAQNDGDDFWADYEIIQCQDGNGRRVKPGVPLLAHGVRSRVAKLRGLGNAIVPQAAAAFIKAYIETMTGEK